MLVLAVDTSTIACSVAVADENKLYGEFYTDYKLKHSEKLMPLIDELLKNIRISLRDIDAFVLVNGPGSFTGLRIGAASIKGFAQALSKPVVCVSTLETLAMAQSNCQKVICPILDAQRDQVYTCRYIYENKELKPLNEQAALSIENLVELLNKTGGEETFFCGDAVYRYKNYITESYKKSFFAENAFIMPHACFAAQIGISKVLKGQTVSYNEIDINYIRSSQAEVNYKIQL